MSASISEDVSLLYCFLPFEDLNVTLEKANKAATVTMLTTLVPRYFCFLSFIVKDSLSYCLWQGVKIGKCVIVTP